MRGTRFRVGVVTLIAVAIPAVAIAATTEQSIRPGTYLHEAGQRTTDAAVFFRVTGTGTAKRIERVEYRNDCLTHNGPSPPVAIASDGSFKRRWTHSRGEVTVELNGRFVGATRAKGTLRIAELGCKSRFDFTARRR